MVPFDNGEKKKEEKKTMPINDEMVREKEKEREKEEKRRERKRERRKRQNCRFFSRSGGFAGEILGNLVGSFCCPIGGVFVLYVFIQTSRKQTSTSK